MLFSLRLALGGAYCVGSAWYCRSVVQDLRPGLARLASVVPLVACDFCLPRLFNPATEGPALLIYALILTFLHSFKVVGLALKRGILSQPLSLAQTVAALGLPVSFSTAGKRQPRSSGSSWGVAAKLPLLVVLLYAELHLRDTTGLQEQLLHLAYAWVLYVFMGIAMDCASAILLGTAGMQLKPHFDKPYLSTSLQEFWGQRWNNSVAGTLRSLVFDPIMEGQLIHEGPAKARASRTRRAIAMTATFAVSGLFHEILLMYYKVGWENHGYWFVFFSIQGPLYLAESWLRHILRQRGLRPPKWAGILAVHAVLLVTAHFFFFPPAIRSNIGPQFFDSLRRTLSWLPGLHSLLSPLEQL